jgi:hypothetical protein
MSTGIGNVGMLQFVLLTVELVGLGDLADSRHVSAQEQLAILVYWMVYGSSQRELQEQFQWSGYTISKYLNQGLQHLTGAVGHVGWEPTNICNS